MFSLLFLLIRGRVAQLVEHHLDMVVVVGSSPIVATIFYFWNPIYIKYFVDTQIFISYEQNIFRKCKRNMWKRQ